jgi:hypothetical protein
MSDKQAKYFGKKTVKEASDDDADFDNISHGVSSPEEKKKQEKSMIDTFKKSGKKANPDSQIGRLMKKHGVSLESKMMPKGKKRPVKESVETKLSFKQMVQLVQESGGQQQIDAVDKALFTWAERVAKNKLGEGMKADLYAGLVYERNGGVFEMYDVLNESKKKSLSEGRERLDEGIIDSIKKQAKALIAKLSPGTMEKITDLVQSALGKPIEKLSMADVNMSNIKKVLAANGAKEDNEVPGSLEKNRAGAAKIGGVLGALGGLLVSTPLIVGGAWAAIPGMTVGLVVAGVAIVVALLARETADPDTMPDTNPTKPQEKPFAGNPDAQALYKAKMKAASDKLFKDAPRRGAITPGQWMG